MFDFRLWLGTCEECEFHKDDTGHLFDRRHHPGGYWTMVAVAYGAVALTVGLIISAVVSYYA